MNATVANIIEITNHPSMDLLGFAGSLVPPNTTLLDLKGIFKNIGIAIAFELGQIPDAECPTTPILEQRFKELLNATYTKTSAEVPTVKPAVKILVSQSDADQIALETADAYSFDRYGANRWQACCRMLAKMGLSAKGIEAIMRSKYTRWAGDASDNEYGKVNSADLKRYLLSQKEGVKAIAKDLLRGN